MAEYKTIQKKSLIEFLKAHNEQSFTIEEIAKMMSYDKNSHPALSTLYRLMPKLIEEGYVKKFSGSKSRRFLYQIIDKTSCGNHLHMKCICCGKLLHMNNEISKKLLDEVLNESAFQVDKEKTVLMGICNKCTSENIPTKKRMLKI